MPVSACTWRAVRSIASSVTAWTDAAMSISRWVIGVSGWRGGPPNSASNFGDVIRSPSQYRKYDRSRRNDPSSFKSIRCSRIRSA